jgi:hypothetical protein
VPFFFIALAAFWSAAMPILGLWGSVVWYPVVLFLPPGDFNGIFIFLTGIGDWRRRILAINTPYLSQITKTFGLS